MKRALFAVAVTLSIASGPLSAARQTGQPGALSSKTQQLQSELLISSLVTADLTKAITEANGKIEHESEVARGGPVAAVVRTTGCQKDDAGTCKVNVDVTVYRPDGSVFHEVKNLDLPQGRGAIPLKVDAQAPTGVYRAVVRIRDLTARRFGTIERQFGVK